MSEQAAHDAPEISEPLVVRSNPFAQGLNRDIALTLAQAKRAPEKKIQAAYHRTPHFKRLKQAAIALYGSCATCGRPPGKGSLTVHHRHYRSLFQEHLTRDVALVCSRCHRKIHRK